MAKPIDFGRQVNADRAPSDTAPTTNTSRGPKLVVPSCKFVRQPLSITASHVGSRGATTGVAQFGIETRIPMPHAIDLGLIQIGNFFHRRAKTRRANHCAVGTRQAPTGNVIPSRVFQIFHQQRRDTISVKMFCQRRLGRGNLFLTCIALP